MLKALRLLTLFITPAFFWGAWYVLPGILTTENLRWLSGVVTILWGFEFYFFQRLSQVSSVDGLSSREHERLVLKLASIRRRVWWIGGIGLMSSICIWLLAAVGLPMDSPIYASLVGVLLGISLSYLILIPGWLNESQHFIDDARKRDVFAKRREESVKNLTAK